LGTECPAVVQRATSQSGWISSWPKTSTIVAPFPWPNVHGRNFFCFSKSFYWSTWWLIYTSRTGVLSRHAPLQNEYRQNIVMITKRWIEGTEVAEILESRRQKRVPA
jgi:hypothetical protein